jgi:hypothetical protein
MSTPSFHFNCQKILIKQNTTGNKMKKIILTAILSSFLSTTAIAADHVMRNDNPNPSVSVMEGQHMMNSNPNASVMDKKHMMNSNPNSSRSATKAAITDKKPRVGRVVPYKK